MPVSGSLSSASTAVSSRSHIFIPGHLAMLIKRVLAAGTLHALGRIDGEELDVPRMIANIILMLPFHQMPNVVHSHSVWKVNILESGASVLFTRTLQCEIQRLVVIKKHLIERIKMTGCHVVFRL